MKALKNYLSSNRFSSRHTSYSELLNGTDENWVKESVESDVIGAEREKVKNILGDERKQEVNSIKILHANRSSNSMKINPATRAGKSRQIEIACINQTRIFFIHEFSLSERDSC